MTFKRVYSVSVITWAGQGAGLFQEDLSVSVHGQLQAVAQLLVHQTAFSFSGAVRHVAGQVPVACTVSTHHILTGQEHHRRRRRMMSYGSERGELQEPKWFIISMGADFVHQ